MKILFTGATGVRGPDCRRRPRRDHRLRSPEDAAWLEETGARSEAFDLFDPDEIDLALAGMDTVVHFATAIPPM